jgi:hypothetical protein
MLYGSETVGQDARPGGRLSVGLGLDPLGLQVVEGRFFMLGQERTSFTADWPSGLPILARPFLNAAGAQSSRLLGYPAVFNPGTVTVQSESDVLGGDVLYRWGGAVAGSTRLGLVAGYQFARIDESLVITDATNRIAFPVGPSAITDAFATRNEFHGGAIGLSVRHDRPGWRLDLLAKIAFGNMYERVAISFQNSNAALAGGLLANGVNLGEHSRRVFAVSPEVGLTCVRQFNEVFELSAGYTFIYWSNVAQPAGQIDPSLLSPTLQYAIADTGFWVHGLHVGGQVRF